MFAHSEGKPQDGMSMPDCFGVTEAAPAPGPACNLPSDSDIPWGPEYNKHNKPRAAPHLKEDTSTMLLRNISPHTANNICGVQDHRIAESANAFKHTGTTSSYIFQMNMNKRDIYICGKHSSHTLCLFGAKFAVSRRNIENTNCKCKLKS